MCSGGDRVRTSILRKTKTRTHQKRGMERKTGNEKRKTENRNMRLVCQPSHRCAERHSKTQSCRVRHKETAARLGMCAWCGPAGTQRGHTEQGWGGWMQPFHFTSLLYPRTVQTWSRLLASPPNRWAPTRHRRFGSQRGWCRRLDRLRAPRSNPRLQTRGRWHRACGKR